MKIVGITGSLGMGKSSIARILRLLGFPVFDADNEVRKMINSDQSIIKKIILEFPNSVMHGEIDKEKLADEIYGQSDRLKALEKILHPAVRFQCERFLDNQRSKGSKLVFIDIPLLYETGYDEITDAVWVAWCEPHLRYERVKKRSKISDDRIEKIIEAQLADDVKKHRADRVINTSGKRKETVRLVGKALQDFCNSKEIKDVT